jgi:hypothetical protein
LAVALASPSIAAGLLVNKQQDSMTSISRSQVSRAELLIERSFQLLKSPSFSNLDFDRKASVARLCPQSDIGLLLVDNV